MRLSKAAILTIAIAATTTAGAPAVAQQAAPSHREGRALRPETNLVAPQAWSSARSVRPNAQPIVVTAVEAKITITEQVATTRLLIRLRNPAARAQEAVLLLPVPTGAAVRGFDFEGGAAEPTAKLLSADEARATYGAIVGELRDPALLEFAGTAAIRSSVFPVPAGGEQAVSVTWEHLCPRDGARIDYVLPRTQLIASAAGIPWTITAKVQSKGAISTTWSPSHPVSFARHDEHGGDVGIVGGATTDPGSFLLSWLIAGDAVTASLLAYPDPRIGGGYFLLLAGLPADLGEKAEHTVDREVSLVIDRSGSMRGEKMEQAKAAALQVLEGLREGEAFNVIAYSNAVERFAPEPVRKTAESLEAARAYVRSLTAGGGTNLHDAIVEAVRQDRCEGVLPLVLLLSDGLPTIGVTGEVAIRASAKKANVHQRRIFAVGVGHDVNAPLLDNLSQHTRGTMVTVLPREDVEVKVSSLFEKLSGPILAAPEIGTVTADGKPITRRVHDLHPTLLPDLFRGDQLVLVGRYRGEDPLRFRLSGDFLGEAKTFALDFELDRASVKNVFVARLWANRRIAFLVDQLRQLGAESASRINVRSQRAMPQEARPDPRRRELIDEIVALSTEFGILTEYTSFLALEGTDLADAGGNSQRAGDNVERAAVRTRSGKHATSQQGNIQGQRGQTWANPAMNAWNDESMNRVAIATVQQVGNRAFYRRGSRWIDGDVLKMKEMPKVTPLLVGSAEFEDVLAALDRDGNAGVLALGADSVVIVGGEAYRLEFPEVEPPADEKEPEQEPEQEEEPNEGGG